MDVSPDKQNIDSVFSNTRYRIDFYQRDYKWTDEPVQRLLDDIFFKFDEIYQEYESLTPTEVIIDEKYPWYYLNTYVTNQVEGRVFIVDGQQRLTTLSLILIKFLHMAKNYQSDLEKWIDNKVAGQSGYESEFWISHDGHKKIQQALYDNDLARIDAGGGITASNMLQNFKVISRWLDNQLITKHKFETFVFYFLRRLVLINLTVEQTDVPMVFEVINDRGVRLKPFEILKGKLLGQIDKTLLKAKKYNEFWEEAVNSINSYDEDEMDKFFRFWLKSKFTSTRKDGQAFDGDYHRIMFSSKFKDGPTLAHNQAGVIEFLDGPFKYYTKLYQKIWEAYSDETSEMIYNRVNDLDGSFLLVLSSCEINDLEEVQKLKQIPYELDRLFSLLQLQNAYDSNSFQDMLFKISLEIREKPAQELRSAFDKYLKEELAKHRLVEVDQSFKYIYFKQTGINLSSRFKRYFFARIDEFLAKNMGLNMKHSVSDLTLKTGAKTGFHIEHILAYNDENLELFNGNEEKFEEERNRLGAILLLKGKDNISSSNEAYREKIKTYANTLYWNETLRADSYKSKLDMKKLKQKYGLDLESIDNFGPEQIEVRQKLLFEISSVIWN